MQSIATSKLFYLLLVAIAISCTKEKIQKRNTELQGLWKLNGQGSYAPDDNRILGYFPGQPGDSMRFSSSTLQIRYGYLCRVQGEPDSSNYTLLEKGKLIAQHHFKRSPFVPPAWYYLDTVRITLFSAQMMVLESKATLVPSTYRWVYVRDTLIR